MKLPPTADTVIRKSRRFCCTVFSSGLHKASSLVNRGTHAGIGAATADVADLCVDIGVGWSWIALQQCRSGHEHAGLAVTALRNVVFDPDLLQRVRSIL